MDYITEKTLKPLYVLIKERDNTVIKNIYCCHGNFSRIYFSKSHRRIGINNSLLINTLNTL